MIQVSKPFMGAAELNEVGKVFQTGWLGMGSWVKEFEDKICSYIQSKECIAVNTGTNALHLAFDILDFKAGDEVIVPSLTFIATIQSIIQAGGTPVFCDVEESTLNLKITDLKQKITSKTKAIVPVHYRGLPCNMEELLSLADKHGLVVVEDAAHAFGSSYHFSNGSIAKIGSFGHLTCFSFDPIKVITCGEGGAVCTNNHEWAERIRKKRILGIDKDTWSRYKNERSWFYDVVERGYRHHMSNINAAIGCKQLEQIDNFINRRQEICKKYDEKISDSFFNGRLELLHSDYNQMAVFTYIVRVLNDDRSKLMDYLKSKEVSTGINYIPCHTQSICKNYRSENLITTNKIANEILTLPLYFGLLDQEVDSVVKLIRNFYETN
ncbi:MAG: DegT/DnrJ/EryC1/StrS family aminotransferase [Oligoflexia bacterium]|nr:DegT/DnrJ/EryC1/StrS family aminotransferase [Oligoflexia bacterium]